LENLFYTITNFISFALISNMSTLPRCREARWRGRVPLVSQIWETEFRKLNFIAIKKPNKHRTSTEQTPILQQSIPHPTSTLQVPHKFAVWESYRLSIRMCRQNFCCKSFTILFRTRIIYKRCI